MKYNKWIFTDCMNDYGYRKWELVHINDKDIILEVAGAIYNNSEGRQRRYKEAPWGTTILGRDEDDNEIALPDTITNIEDAKAYVLALYRLEGI